MGVKEKIMDITTIIIGLLIVLLIGYTAFFAYDLIKHKDEFEGDTSWWKTGAIAGNRGIRSTDSITEIYEADTG